MGKKKITLEEAQQEFIIRNLTPLFDEYKNNKEKLLAQTQEGYLVITSIDKLKTEHKPNIFDPHNYYTLGNIKLWLKLNNKKYNLLSDKYESNNKKLIFSSFENYLFTQCWSSMKFGHKPAIFHKSNPYTIQNIKLWCKLNNKPFELLSDIYKNNSEKLKWRCLKGNCGEEFKASWSDIQSGYGCGVCEGRQVKLSNCLATKNPDLASEWYPILNINLTPYDVPVNSGKKVWWLCKECGHKWEALIYSRNSGNGCPQCSESKGEKRIKKYFNYCNINYIWQKEFDNLLGIGNGNLSYDFYLPQCNLLIEYQGNYHDGTVGAHIQSKEDFEKQIEHDRRKREYAQNNNINLLEIWYWDFDNIEEILEKYFNQ